MINFKKLFILLSLFFVPAIKGYVTGFLVMKNPKNNKTLILLADIHDEPQEFSCLGYFNEFDDVSLMIAQQQQEDLFNLIQKLQKKNKQVQVIVEDPLSLLLNRGQYTDCLSSPGVVVLDRLTYTPLALFDVLCQEKNIDCVNIEFRQADPRYVHTVRDTIKKNSDAALMKKLAGYYKKVGDAPFPFDLPYYIDAYILQKIKKGTASIQIVFAGIHHIAAVAKIAYQEGYTDVVVESSGVKGDLKTNLCNYAVDEPLFGCCGDSTPCKNLEKSILNSIALA